MSTDDVGTVIYLFPRHRAHRADKFSHPAFRRTGTYMVNGRINKYAGPVDLYVPAHRAPTPNRPDRLDIW
jgi:hypothetical protein